MIRWTKSLLKMFGPLVAVLGVVAFFAIVDVTLHGDEAIFWSRQNLQSISVQNAFVAICALGMLIVIISGGIDLSAGAALALCATIFAWGLREDVGFLLSHGENVGGAVARLRSSEDRNQHAIDADDTNRIERAKSDTQHFRDRLIELLQIKRTQLELSRTSNAQRADAELERRISDIDQAMAEAREHSSIAADPAWLRSVPNAVSTAW